MCNIIIYVINQKTFLKRSGFLNAFYFTQIIGERL
nr:MAG TPA: hypothetical protein [Caudoviricetes sp.]